MVNAASDADTNIASGAETLQDREVELFVEKIGWGPLDSIDDGIAWMVAWLDTTRGGCPSGQLKLNAGRSRR